MHSVYTVCVVKNASNNAVGEPQENGESPNSYVDSLVSSSCCFTLQLFVNCKFCEVFGRDMELPSNQKAHCEEAEVLVANQDKVPKATDEFVFTCPVEIFVYDDHDYLYD